MRLESARELRSSLVERVLKKMALTPREISAYGLSSRRLRAVPTVLPTLVLGVAPGRRPGDYKVALRIQRRGMQDSPHVRLIEKESRGEIDTRYVGRVVKRGSRWFRSRHRPLRIGTSIGHYRITAGTLGCFVTVNGGDGSVRIVSNNHVLADENEGKSGDEVLQPGRYDGGRRRRDTVGMLDAFAPLEERRSNSVDCALSTVADSIEYDIDRLRGRGRLTGVASPPELVSDLEKLGRTTGHTVGRVSAFELDNLVVEYDLGYLRFDGQIEIEDAGPGPFSEGGDSGSLIFTPGREAFGLLFAGTQAGGVGLTYANPIEEVLRTLDVELLA